MDLREKREQIDNVDRAIVELLVKRAEIARDICILKMRAGLPMRDVARETVMLQRLASFSDGVVDKTAVTNIYETILAESRRLQAKAREEIATNGVLA